MSPVNQCTLSSANDCLYPDCLNGYEGERIWVGTHRSISRCVGDVDRSPFFSGAVDPFNSVGDSMKDCHIRGPSIRSVRAMYVD
jgi:hypothetical protein